MKDCLEPIQILKKKKIPVQSKQNMCAGSRQPLGQHFAIFAL